MKKINVISLEILAISLLLLFAGCEKFKILKDEDMDLVPAGENTKNATFAAFIRSGNYHQADRYSQLKIYAQAVKITELEEFLDNPDDNFTIVMFNDDAMQNLIAAFGYQSLEEIPRPALKHFILNNIIRNKYQSADFPVSVDMGFESLTGDSLFFTRQSSATNPYILNINAVSRYLSQSVTVRSRDLPFKNAIGHVVTLPTYTTLSLTKADSIPADLTGQKRDSIFVSKDAYIQYGNATQIRSVNDPELQIKTASGGYTNVGTRRAFLQFSLREPEFGDKLGSALLYIYHARTTNAGTVTSTRIDIHEDGNTDWDENAIHLDPPSRGVAVAGGFTVPVTSRNTWYNGDISRTIIDAFEQNKSFVNLSVMTPDLPNVFFASREASDGATKSYILFLSPPPSIISDVLVSPVDVSSANFIRIINMDNLKATGASDKNILYYLEELPQKGVILSNGLPLKKGGHFTQEQLTNGTVRYLFDGRQGESGTDEIKLEIKDYRGGYYNEIITLPIHIN